MKPSISTVISYCTNDYRFIGKCIEEARKFSAEIVVPVCDHFFDGTAENRILLESTYAENPDCQFIEFSYMPDRLYSRYHPISPDDRDWAIYWAATTRYVGLHYLMSQTEYVFFLDSDEIAEGDSFLAWLNGGAYQRHDALRFAAYLYALKPTLRAKKVVNLPLLVKKSTLAPLTLLNGLERIGAYLTHPGPKREEVVGLTGKPLIHHYSWVRTKEECIQKTQTWGHRHDADWLRLIDEAFSGRATQFFDTQLEFEEISDFFFDPLSVPIAPVSSPSQFGNVLKIDHRDLFRRELHFV